MDKVTYIKDIFTQEQLDELLKDLSSESLVDGKIGENSKVDSSIRAAKVFHIPSEKYKWLYEKLYELLGFINSVNYNKELTGLEPLQYIVYDPSNGFYKPHLDTNSSDGRAISFSIHLCYDYEYEGGELMIKDGDNIKTALKDRASITFFESNMVHEVTQITSGIRKVIVGWAHAKHPNN